MTRGVLQPQLAEVASDAWRVREFKGNAGMMVDVAARGAGDDEALTVMVVGHADKIRMQVRHVSDDGKIYINSDSFLPLTLIGNEVTLFSRPQSAGDVGEYRAIRGGTVEALGAIHFADAAIREGKRGVAKTDLYLDLQMHGKNAKKRLEAMGIRPGDPILMDRPIRHGFCEDTFQGAYLDNGLGCFVTSELARLVAERQPQGAFENVRMMYTFAAWEEIGRFGSRVMASEMRPDIIIAVDVNHDYVAAPAMGGNQRWQPLAMGKGFTISTGSVASDQLNKIIVEAARANDIPHQLDVNGVDTGTDAMAGVLGAVDAAVTSIGFPIRNMHTISETGHTGDVLAAVHGIYAAIEAMDTARLTADDLRKGHPQLHTAVDVTRIDPVVEEDEAEGKDE